MMDDITLFISSCDKNEDLWPIFFQILDKQWPESKNIHIVLNTETKSFSYAGYDIFCPCMGGDISWSERCKKSLEHVNTKYCLFILDDFFIAKRVNHSDFVDLLLEIKATRRFGCVYLCAMRSLYMNKKVPGKHFLLDVNPYANYKAQMVPAIWRTTLLKRLIYPDVDIWEAELRMRDKSYAMGNIYKYYTLKEYEINKEAWFKRDIPNSWVLCYDYRMQCVKGKWSESLKEYLMELDIKIDFERRGVIQYDFDGYAQAFLNLRDEIMKKGSMYYTFYMFMHNFLIPQLSKMKYYLIKKISKNS